MGILERNRSLEGLARAQHVLGREGECPLLVEFVVTCAHENRHVAQDVVTLRRALGGRTEAHGREASSGRRRQSQPLGLAQGVQPFPVAVGVLGAVKHGEATLDVLLIGNREETALRIDKGIGWELVPFGFAQCGHDRP
jgi:hypothetical protein